MRLLRHLFAPSSRRLFPEDSLARIAHAVAAGERRHRGEIVFAVESELPLGALLRGVRARQRAEDAFARLKVWDTEANNGVLIYLLLADHCIEIVADRGLRALGDDAWRQVCLQMQQRLRQGEPEAAVVGGIEAVSALIARQFPRADGGDDGDLDELPNRPVLLD